MLLMLSQHFGGTKQNESSVRARQDDDYQTFMTKA